MKDFSIGMTLNLMYIAHYTLKSLACILYTPANYLRKAFKQKIFIIFVSIFASLRNLHTRLFSSGSVNMFTEFTKFYYLQIFGIIKMFLFYRLWFPFHNNKYW